MFTSGRFESLASFNLLIFTFPLSVFLRNLSVEENQVISTAQLLSSFYCAVSHSLGFAIFITVSWTSVRRRVMPGWFLFVMLAAIHDHHLDPLFFRDAKR